MLGCMSWARGDRALPVNRRDAWAYGIGYRRPGIGLFTHTMLRCMAWARNGWVLTLDRNDALAYDRLWRRSGIGSEQA